MKKNLLFFCFFIFFSTLLKAQNYDTLKTLFINKSYSPQIQQTKQDSQINNLINPNVFCGGTDKRVLTSTNPQSEVHISIDKTNTNNILTSANTFTTTYNQGYYYTTNGGTSWAGADQLPGSTTVYGDPSTAYDIAGNAFIATMSPNLTAQDADGYFIQKSINKGVSWNALLRASDTRLNFDKEMIAADNYSTSPYKNYVYAAWSDLTPGVPTIRFNRSTNGGKPLNTSNTSNVTKMYLYDFYTGVLVKQWTFNEMKSINYNLNIAGVKTGAYVLKMERNNKTTSTKIIVQ